MIRALLAPALLLGVSLSVLVAPRVARADDAATLTERCQKDPDSALCREVRRACALRTVRDEVAPACHALGWWGEDERTTLRHLCPIEPTHARCVAMRERCARGESAGLPEFGAMCDEMGWPRPDEPDTSVLTTPPGGDDDAPTQAELDEFVEFCQAHPADDTCGKLRDLCARAVAGDSAQVTSVCRRLAYPMAGEQATSMGGANQSPAAAPSGRRARASVDLVTLDLRVGSVHGAARTVDEGYDGAATTVSGFAQAFTLGMPGHPLAYGAELDLGSSAKGGLVYDLHLVAGGGHWFGPHFAGALLIGGEYAGLARHRITPTLAIPLRAQLVSHVGDRLTVTGWVELAYVASGPDQRRAAAGALVIVGSRPAANDPLRARVSLGVVVQEHDGVRSFSVLLGIGMAQDPWNRP